ncbi:Uncharacterised protein [Vibrio cholerae]|nr:Uncharacterised protein [Vibrio cholerae]
MLLLPISICFPLTDKSLLANQPCTWLSMSIAD